MRDGGRTFRRFGWPALLLLGACEAPTAPSPAAVMLGGWTYDSPTIGDHAPSPNTGLHVTLAVDSVQGMRFFGRVTRWFSGDVGIAPDAFGPLTGSVDGAGGVTVVIARAVPGTPSLTTTGEIAGDVLTVRDSWFGAEPGPFPSGDRFRRAP
jgi:hypothetical protein